MGILSPVELLFGNYRREVLALLLLQSEERYYVREIARLTGVVPGSLHRELKQLAAAGILVRQQRGNQVVYFANTESPIFTELSGIFRKLVTPTLFDTVVAEKPVVPPAESVPDFDANSVRQLFAAARRNLADAEITSISLGLRFDAAYKALMQTALVVMIVSKSQMTNDNSSILASISADKLEALDALRRRRNNADYSGAPVGMAATDGCIVDARQLVVEVKTWLQKIYPECL